MREYTDRRKVYHNGAYIGDVAQFGPRDFRCSSAKGSPIFRTRAEAEKHRIEIWTNKASAHA